MAYIGVPPADRTSGARVRDEFTADGTQVCFQLSQEVPGSFESNIIAVVENVIQEPVSAYTIVDTVTVGLTSISGTFVKNETITGGTSAATGKVIQVNTSNIVIKVVSGTFQAAETITGGGSSATATISSLTTNVGRGLNFTGTPSAGAKVYVLHQAAATYNVKPAAGSVTPETLSDNLRTFTVDKFTATSSQTAFTLSATPVSVKSILVFVDGVMQTETTHYTLSGATLTMGSALAAGQQVTVVHLGFSTVSRTAFADSTVTTSMIADGAITSAKIADGTVIASDVADGSITTAKLNSTLDLSGKTITYRTIVEGDIASNAITNAKIADDAVGIAELSATGTANSTTFLRGDNSWAVVAVTPTAVSDQANTSTGYFALPSGTTAERPGSPTNGMTRYNSSLNTAEIYINGNWGVFGTSIPPSVQSLVIAGGAGGGYSLAGYQSGGGGGAGGYRSSVTGESSGGGASAESALSIVQGTVYTVTVGAGGAGGDAGAASSSQAGSNSVFGSITSTGGGRGGNASSVAGHTTAGSGGSGGGAQYYNGQAANPGTGTSGQGYAGGTSSGNSTGNGAGGGGGAGGVGGNGGTSTAGGGGVGVASSITGSSVYRAGGGGAGVVNSCTGGAGGNGGGGSGAIYGSANAVAGTANTGGGGGGGILTTYTNGGNGGSGVVIIRYANTYADAASTTGSPTYTNTGGYKIYTFNSSGTITW